jgi:hypothetical protein
LPDRRSILLGGTALAAASALSMAATTQVARAQQPAQPNILFMLADNVGYGVPSCYNGGILDTPTPRIDQLAAEGLMHTEPGCADDGTAADPLRHRQGDCGRRARRAAPVGDHDCGDARRGRLPHGDVRQMASGRRAGTPADRPGF